MKQKFDEYRKYIDVPLDNVVLRNIHYMEEVDTVVLTIEMPNKVHTTVQITGSDKIKQVLDVYELRYKDYTDEELELLRRIK